HPCRFVGPDSAGRRHLIRPHATRLSPRCGDRSVQDIANGSRFHYQAGATRGGPMSVQSVRSRILSAGFMAAPAGLAGVASLAVTNDAAAQDTVNIYTTRQETLIQPVLDAYRDASGAEVNVIFIKEGLVERLQSEGANSPADVVLTADVGAILQVDEAGLLQPIQSDAIDA